MKTWTITLLIFLFSLPLTAQNWQLLSTDPAGDGFVSSRADASEFSYRYDPVTDSIWFRMDLHSGFNPFNWGMNILVDTDLDPQTGREWPSFTNPFSFDVGLTVWVTGSPGNYSGTVGVSDANTMMSGNFSSLYQNNVTLMVDTVDSAYTIGLPRMHLDSLDATFDVLGSVGIAWESNDLAPDAGGVRIDELLNTHVQQPHKEHGFFLYPNPARELVRLSKPAHYQMVSPLGTVVAKGNTTFPNEEIELSHLPAGTYLLVVWEGREKIVLPLVHY